MRPPNKPRSRGRQAQIDALHRCEAAHTALRFVDMQHGFLVAGASLQVPWGRAHMGGGIRNQFPGRLPANEQFSAAQFLHQRLVVQASPLLFSPRRHDVSLTKG
jgi:hypothetical protein